MKKDLLAYLMYFCILTAMVAGLLIVPTIIVALGASFLSWLSGIHFFSLFCIGMTLVFAVSGILVESLRRDISNFKIELDLDEEDKDMII